jgi:thiamine-monophosphate kinase
MKDVSAVNENVLIDSWARFFSRTPLQINRRHEADAELVELAHDPEHYLAITIDSVVEEILTGLYQDPQTMGWITVMASLSDLAAVGAEPLGLVISVTTAPDAPEELRAGIAQGMEAACRKAGCFILGGDTNAGPTTALTSCAVGLVPRHRLMTRIGCSSGDAVFVTGRMGKGNAFGLVRLSGLPEALAPEPEYRPVARLNEGRLIARHAGCCMDTSDGLLATLDQLMRLNGLGFAVNCDWGNVLAPEALTLCEKTRTPRWTMLAGPHGEFELVFTVAEDRCETFLADVRTHGFDPIRIGSVQPKPELHLSLPSGRTVSLDMAPIRNLLDAVGGDLNRYIQEFLAYGQRAGLE